MIPSSPPPPALAAAADLATRAEQRLARWFDLEPNPTLDQIATATQAIWRLAAVRKTLLIAAHGYPVRPKSLRELDPELARIVGVIADLEVAVTARLAKSKPSAPNPPATTPDPSPPDAAAAPDSAFGTPHSEFHISTAAVPSADRSSAFDSPKPPSLRFPSLAPYRSPSLRRAPSAPALSSPSPFTRRSAPREGGSTLSTPSPSSPSSPISACPSLRAPLHTARAAAGQVDSLFKSSGLARDPDPASPFPTLPAPSDPPAPSAALTPLASGEFHKSSRPLSGNSPSPPLIGESRRNDRSLNDGL